MTVHCRVALDPPRHELDIEMTFDADEGTDVYLWTPTWVPGDYEFQAYGRDVFGVRATDREGAAVNIERHGWQGYVVRCAPSSLRITYRALASSVDFSEACGVLGNESGVVLGTRYLRVADHAGPWQVRYEVPEGWAIHHPAGAVPSGPATWVYPNYEILLDTPVSFGRFDLLTRNVRGTDFHHVFLNRAEGFAEGVERLLDELVKVADIYHGMFGSFPFENYTYVLSFNPNDSWGLEHLTSTMVGLDPATFYDPDQFGVSVRVCAHELFHAWNVRRLRPRPLGDIAFEKGCFTDGLWVAEGFTRYYEFLTCTRTGVYSPAQFLSAVTNYYTHLAPFPAFDRVSPADASLATYLNHDKYPGRPNSAIDYYDAGMVIAFELDATLRMASADDSLDRMFAAFYERFVGQGAGYTIDDLSAFAEDRLPGLGVRLSAMARTPGQLDPQRLLGLLGFDVIERDVPYLGLVLQDETGPSIYAVLDTSPAGAAGLAAEDVLQAVNGFPFSMAALRAAAAGTQPVRLSVLRGNVSLDAEVPPGRRTTITDLRWAGNADQAGRIARWLNQPFDPVAGQAVALDFYENFHGIETVI